MSDAEQGPITLCCGLMSDAEHGATLPVVGLFLALLCCGAGFGIA